MKKTLKTIAAVLLSISLCMISAVFSKTAHAEIVDNSSISEIEELITERSALLALYLNSDDPNAQDRLQEKTDVIDNRLIELGVEFLTQEEVEEQFPDASDGARRELNRSARTTWMTYNLVVIENGVMYRIKELVAQPATSDSPLAEIKRTTKTYNANWTAGAVNAVKCIGGTIIGEAFPVTKTIYDIASAFISGLNTTTVVYGPSEYFRTKTSTTVEFRYVRLYDQSEEYQVLSMIASMTQAEVYCEYDDFYYQPTPGGAFTQSSTISGGFTQNIVPTGYNDYSLAITSYLAGANYIARRTVEYAQILGPLNSTVHTIYPCSPNSPAQCD